jgi:hypothetical protein
LSRDSLADNAGAYLGGQLQYFAAHEAPPRLQLQLACHLDPWRKSLKI